jgi:hypothetical protein
MVSKHPQNPLPSGKHPQGALFPQASGGLVHCVSGLECIATFRISGSNIYLCALPGYPFIARAIWSVPNPSLLLLTQSVHCHTQTRLAMGFAPPEFKHLRLTWDGTEDANFGLI